MTRLRPAAVFGDRITIGDIKAIVDTVDQWGEDASIRILSPYLDEEEREDQTIAEHPWTTEWTGVAVVVHGAAILVPIVGEWPFGPDMHPDDVEPRDVTVADLMPALMALVPQTRRPDAKGDRFVAHDESMQRIVDLLIAHAQSEEKTAQVVEFCDDGEGTLLCEIGMDEHGLPVLFMESSGWSQHDVDVEYEKRLAISRIEPLCMTAHATEFVFDGRKTSTVVLTPVLGMDSLETIEGRMHGPIEIIRILAAHSDRISAGDAARANAQKEETYQ